MDIFWIEVGLVLSAAAATLAGVAAVLVWPPRVVELSLDPPEDAHYVVIDDDDQRRRILESQIFYLAWTRNSGKLSRRTLWQIVEEWNKQYAAYPQYENWQIRRDDMTATIRRYFETSEPIPLKVTGKIEWFVVVPDGPQARALQPLRDLLGIEKPGETEKEPGEVVNEPVATGTLPPVLILNGAAAASG